MLSPWRKKKGSAPSGKPSLSLKNVQNAAGILPRKNSLRTSEKSQIFLKRISPPASSAGSRGVTGYPESSITDA
jgi:hypothetical protein